MVACQRAKSQLENGLHPYLEAVIKGAFHHLFLCVSDPLSALD